MGSSLKEIPTLLFLKDGEIPAQKDELRTFLAIGGCDGMFALNQYADSNLKYMSIIIEGKERPEIVKDNKGRTCIVFYKQTTDKEES